MCVYAHVSLCVILYPSVPAPLQALAPEVESGERTRVCMCVCACVCVHALYMLIVSSCRTVLLRQAGTT